VKGDGRRAPDLVERDFTAEAPDRLWVADITYIPTSAGSLYFAVVLDAFSRRIVGWSMATTLATQLVLVHRRILQSTTPSLIDRLSFTDRLRVQASGSRCCSRRTSACCRARGRQGQALRAAAGCGRP
jgi:putative transposase